MIAPLIEVENLRIDLDAEDTLLAIHLNGDHAASGGCLEDFVLQLLLGCLHVLLHLLDLLKHLLHVSHARLLWHLRSPPRWSGFRASLIIRTALRKNCFVRTGEITDGLARDSRNSTSTARFFSSDTNKS